MKNKIINSLLGIFSISLVSAATFDWSNMGPSMMYGSGTGYGMMGVGTGLLGGVLYLLVVVNLIFLAIYLYKKNWGRN